MTVWTPLAVWASAWSLALAVPLEATPPATDTAPVKAAAPATKLHWQRLRLSGICDGGRGELRLTARLVLALPTPQRLQLSLHPALRVTAVTWRGKPVPFTHQDGQIELAELSAHRAGELLITYAGRPHDRREGFTTQDVTSRVALLRPEGGWWPRVQGQAPPESEVEIAWPQGWQTLPLEANTARGRVLTFAAGTSPGFLAGRYRTIRFAGCDAHFFEPAPAMSVRTFVSAFWQARKVPLGAAVPPFAWFELPSGYPPVSAPAGGASRRAPGGDRAALNALIWFPRGAGAALEPERVWLTEGLAADLAVWMDAPKGSPVQRLRRYEQLYADFLQREPVADRPLRQAWQAEGGAWETLVQRKGGMAWALLGDALGPEGLVRFLRDWARRRQEGGGQWRDFVTLVPPHLNLLRSWVEQPGLPVVGFEGVNVQATPAGAWQVSGLLRQHQGPFGLATDLALVTAGGVQRVSFRTFSAQTPFHFVSRQRPLRLVLDGAGRAPFKRREHLRVSEAFAASRAVIVYGTQGDSTLRGATRHQAEVLAKQLQARDGIERAIYPDDDLPTKARNGPLIVLGTPRVNQMTAALKDQFPVRFLSASAESLWWQGRTWSASDHGVVQVIANPYAPEHTLLLLAGLSPKAQEAARGYLDRGATYCVFGSQGVQEGMALRAFPDLEYPLY